MIFFAEVSSLLLIVVNVTHESHVAEISNTTKDVEWFFDLKLEILMISFYSCNHRNSIFVKVGCYVHLQRKLVLPNNCRNDQFGQHIHLLSQCNYSPL